MITLCNKCPDTIFRNINGNWAHVDTNSIFCAQQTIGCSTAGLGVEVWEQESQVLVIVGTVDRSAAERAALKYYTDVVEDIPDELHEAIQGATLKWVNRDHPSYEEDEIWPDDVTSDAERPGDSPMLVWFW